MSPTTSWLILLAFLAAFCLCADRLTQAIHWLLDHAEHHATRALDGMAHDIDGAPYQTAASDYRAQAQMHER